MAGNFTDSEKILYSLKYALLKATVDPENPDYLEPVAPPRVFPTDVMSQSLIENGVGDINSDGTYGGAASISGTVDLTKPWEIVKWYYIIDPTTNVITGNTVNDAITTQAVAETLPSGATSGSAASGSTSYTYYQEYFYGGNVPNATGVPSARAADYKGLRLAYSKASIGTVCAEGNANLVPHISLYLQAPTSWVSPSGTKGDGDNWSYRNPHFRNLLGSEVGFQVSVNNYETGGKRAKIGYNTAGTATEFFWYTQASYGLLSFYGQTTSGFGGDGQANKPYLTFCRYIGESGTLGGGGGGGGGGATTLNALTDVTSSGATDGQALVWDNAASTWKPGSVAAASGGGGGGTTEAAAGGGGSGGSYDTISLDRKGQVLETLTGVCDGRSMTVESGTYTLPVGTKQALSGDPFVDINGTNISYKPPSGTKQVVYSILLHLGAKLEGHTDVILNFVVYLDGNEITKSLITERPGGQWGQGWFNVQFVFDIGNVSSDDYTNGKLASWDTHRIIKVMGREGYPGSYGGWINASHNVGPTGGSGYGAGQVYPQMTIKAIGDESISVGVSALTKENSLTIPNFTGTYTTNKLYNQGDRLKFNGETILTSNNPTINLKGQVLETLAGELDGRTVTVASGTYTLGNVTERYDPASPASGFTAIPNCSINYKPPTGTKVLNYKIRIFAHQKDNVDCFIKFMLYVDGNPITASYEIFGTPSNIYQMQYITYSYQMQIGETDDIPNGKFSNWNSNKLIEIRAMDVGATGETNWEMYLHTSWIPGPEPGNSVNSTDQKSLHRPKLEITAIGEGLVGVQKVVNVLGPGGIRNLSDIHANIGNTVLSSNDAGGQYSGYAAFQTMQNYHSWESHWLTEVVYNATTGVYTGSKLTGTLAGEWLQIKFPQKVKIYKFGIQSMSNAGDNGRGIWNAPKAFVLFGSNDGTSFNNLGQFTIAHPKEYIHDLPSHYDEGARPYAGSRMVYRELSTPQTYQYFRLVVTQNMGNHTNYSDFTAGYGDGRTNISYLAYYGTLETDYANIGDLSDVSDSVSTATTGQTLIYNGSEWAPGAATSTGNVVVSTAFDGGGALKLTEFTGTSTASKLYNDKSSGENVLKFDGKTVLTGEGINRKGQVLETFVGVCDGKSVTVSSGTYTLENVDAILDLNTTYQDITGSKISYKPPSGTNKVKYTFRWYWRFGPVSTPHDNQSIFQIKLFLDGSEVTSFNGTRAHGYYEMSYHEENFIFEIGETNDLANGKISSWNSLKEIKLQAKDAFSGNHETTFHRQWAQGDIGALVHKPTMEITAIGEGVVSVGRNITAITRNLKRRISHPDDGLVVAYHVAGDEDNYGGTYPLENMFKYGVSGISDVGGHSDNYFTSANNWNWTTAKNPAFNATVAPVQTPVGPYVGAEFSEKFVFTSIRILPRVGNGYAQSCPRVFYIYGSNDRVNWDLIFSKSLPSITTTVPSQSVGPYTVGSYTTFEIPDNGVGYKNFHMIVANTYPLSNHTIANFNLIDLSIYGYEADITASIANLKDVDTISAQPEIGQGLVWNGNKWVPGKQVNEGVALDGQVLETLAGVCDGRSVTVSSGSYTLGNVTTYQDLTTTYSLITGSNVNYKPPTGTKQVIYKLYVHAYGKDPTSTAGSGNLLHHVVRLDGIEITSSKSTHRPGGQYTEDQVCITYVIDIGNEDDLVNGKIGSWDTPKTIEAYAREYSSNHEYSLHGVMNLDGSNTGNDNPRSIHQPRIEIQAIGNKLYQPAQIVRTLEGGDGTKLISDISTYTGYEITASVNQDVAPQHPQMNANNAFFNRAYDNGHFWSANTSGSERFYGHNGNGLYIGSTTTATNIGNITGEWIQINFNKLVKVYHCILFAPSYGRAPKDYSILGSHDGIHWTVIHQQVNGPALSDSYNDYNYQRRRTNYSHTGTAYVDHGGQKTTFPSPVTYQYFRCIVQNQYPDTDEYVWINDLEYYGSFFDEVGISKKVSDLIDVDLTAPSDGEALIYDASISKWKPGGNAALNFAPNVVVCYNQDTSTVDGTDRWRRFGVAQGSTTGGLEVTITPTTLTSKIKLSMSLIHCNNENRTTWIVRIIRTINGVSRVVGSDNTDAVVAGTDWGSQFASFVLNQSQHTSHATSSAYDTIDEPQTLSPVTYHIQIASYPSSTRTLRFNRALGGTSLDATVNRSVLIAEEMMGSKALVSHNGYSFNMQPDIIFANHYDTASNVVNLAGWETPFAFPTDKITNTNTSVYSYDAGKITILQDGYYRAIFRVGTSSQNTSGEDARLASAGIAISTDGGASYTTESFNYAGGYGGANDYDSAINNVIVKLNKNDIIFFHGRGSMWSYSLGFSVERLEGTQPLTQEGALVLPEFTGTDTTNRLYAENGLLKFNGKTVDNHSVKNRKGQVLETLVGKADGSTITVDSGTYTMPISTIALGTIIGATYIKETASEITYKAPAGTERIIFQFVGIYSYRDTAGMLEGKFYVDDVEFPGAGTLAHFRHRGGSSPVGRIPFPEMIIKSSEYDLSVPHKYYWNIKGLGSDHELYYGFELNNYTAYDEDTQEIKITAIGDAAIQNATAVSGHSMVHFNGNSSSRNTVTRWDGSTIANIWNNYTGGGTNYNIHQTANFGGCMNKSTGVFTVPHTGLYLICCSGVNTSSDSRGLVYIELISDPKGRYPGDANPDMAIMEIPPTSSGHYPQAGSTITLYLHSGDAIGFRDWSAGSALANFNLSITALQDQVPQTITARPGMTLETLAGVCDGRSITVASGTYTLENVTARQLPSTSNTVITGSTINYKPPTGTTQLIYIFEFAFSYEDVRPIVDVNFFIDNTEVTIARNTVTQKDTEFTYKYKVILSIGDTDDIANGKINGWNSLKTLHTTARNYSGSFEGELHYINNGVPNGQQYVQRPKLEIRAIGDGPGIRPASGGNIVTINDNSQTTFALPITRPGVEITPLRLTITPSATDSVIELKWNVHGENVGTHHWNGSFNVTRTINGVETNVTTGTNNWEGLLSTQTYGKDDQDSTADSYHIRWYDEPNTTSQVIYKLCMINTSTDTNNVFYYNRCEHNTSTSTNAAGYEQLVSNAVAIEHNRHARPYDEDGALTIPTFTGSSTAGKLYNDGGTLKFDGRPLGHKVLGAKGQVLEVLTGICDGSTVKVSSGSYTLENVTLKQTMQDTYLAVSGSSVNYKPPSGTNKIIYNFYTIVRPKQTSGTVRLAFEYRLYVDGTEISSYNAGIYENYKGGGAPSSEFNPSFVLTIGEKDDVVNGHFLSWDSNKVVEIRARSYDGSNGTDNGVTFHEYWWNLTSSGSAGTSGPALFVKPRLEIQAIGDGPSYSPATGTNMVHRKDTIYKSVTLSASSILDYEFSEMRLVITPTATDSVIELKYNIFGDHNESSCYRITRNINGTDVSVIPASHFNEGVIGNPFYETDFSSTPNNLVFCYYDEPNTTSPVTYKLWLGNSHSSSITTHLNRSKNTGTNGSFEKGISNSAAIEHAKRGNPLDAENALSIPEFAGSDPDNKLYNNGGVLHFNGNPVGSGGVMMQFEDTNLLSHQGSYTLKHNETNFCVANENAQLSTFRLTQIGSSGTGKYNVSVVVKNNNAGKLTAIKEQSSTVTVIPIENIYTKVRYQTEPTRDGLIEWFPFDADNKDAIGRKREFKGGSITDATNFHDSKFDGCKCYGCGPGVGGFSSPAYKWSEMGKFTIMFYWKMDNRVNSGSKYFTVCKLGGDNYYTNDAGILDNINEGNGYGFWCLGYWNPLTDYHRFYTHNSGGDTHYIAQSTQICKVHEWNHFAFVYNSSSDFTVYFNGVPTPTKASDGGALTWMDGTYNNWTGVYDQDSVLDSIQTIKDYRVYNRALSAGELTPFQTTIKDTNAGGVAVGNIKPPINLTKNELVSVEVRPIGGEHNKYTTKVNVDLMGNSGTVLDGTSKWDNDTQGISYSAGNVGIGILNPSEKLSISDNVRIDGLIKPKGTSGTPGQVLSLSDDGLSMVWKNETVATVSTSLPGITSSNGNIGIGMTPTQKLQVNGDFHIKSTSNTWSFTAGKGLYMRYSDGGSAGQDEAFIQSIDRSDANNIVYYPLNYQASKHNFINGNVGIGTTTPTVPFHVYSIGSTDFNAGSRYQINSSGGASASGGTGYLSMRVRGRAWFEDYIFATSDRRIKENIEDVPDDLALQQVRNIPTRYYEYKDKINKGESKTIGFIAQEVKEVLPMAVTEQASIIPNENRALNNIEWREYEDKYKLLTNIQNASGVKYRFYVTNDLSDNEVMKEIVGNADNTFTFEEKWEYVFCYGKEVDDFHVLDKQKLFALNFSATQELDRKVARLEEENIELRMKNSLLEQEIMMIKNKLGM